MPTMEMEASERGRSELLVIPAADRQTVGTGSRRGIVGFIIYAKWSG